MITGKSRISGAFSRLRDKGEKGLITYMTAGYPDPGHTLEILKALADAGSDLIEIGVPFSDPIADGPVIQRASQQALEKGTRLQDIFHTAGMLRKHTDLMTYYNPVLRAGIGDFVGKARDSGVDGLIVPDLPVEEDGPLRSETEKAGLSLVPLAAPTSTGQRLDKIAARRGRIHLLCLGDRGNGVQKGRRYRYKMLYGQAEKAHEKPAGGGIRDIGGGYGRRNGPALRRRRGGQRHCQRSGRGPGANRDY